MHFTKGSAGWLKAVAAGAVVMLAFLAATNSWYGWHEGIRITGLTDTLTHERIAAAAPGFPDREFGSAQTERFTFPWVLGSAGELFGDGTQAPFRVMFTLFVIMTVGLLVDICRRLGLGVPATLLCVGLFVLNPYVLRAYAISPSPVDEGFVLGIAILMWGLVAVRFPAVLAGAIAAILGRQTALLAIPAAAVWLYAGTGWRARPSRERLLAVVIPVGTVLVLYGAVKLSVTSFTFTFAPSIPGDTVLPVVGDPGSPSEFATHVTRVATPLVLTAGTIAGVLAGVAWAGGRPQPPVEFWCAVLIGGSIIVQPLVISPHFPGFEANEQRLTAIGLFPICVGVAYLLRDFDASLRTVPPWVLGVGGVALLAASLRPVYEGYTVIGPHTKGQFVAIELLAATILGCLLAFIGHRRQGDLSTRGGLAGESAM